MISGRRIPGFRNYRFVFAFVSLLLFTTCFLFMGGCTTQEQTDGITFPKDGAVVFGQEKSLTPPTEKPEAVKEQAPETVPHQETTKPEPATPLTEPPAEQAPTEEMGSGQTEVITPAPLQGLLSEFAIADVVDQVIHCVVNIRAKRMVESEFYQGAPHMWEQYPVPPQEAPGEGQIPEYESGSGVIISQDGYILTNAHLVGDTEEVFVWLQNGEKHGADLIGVDNETDLALLKIAAKNLKAIELGNSDSVRIGQIVLAIGNPFQFSNTVTMGIISAKNRSGSEMFGDNFYASLLQTDAAINPGNSGGALIDMHGRLIGINTAIASLSGGYQGIGFAVPVDIAKKILKPLQTKGKVTRGHIGVFIQDLSTDLSESFGYPERCGILVSGVRPGSPGEKSGILPGDIINTYNGKLMCDLDELRNAAALTQIGLQVDIRLFRNGVWHVLPIVIEERKPEPLGQSDASQAQQIERVFFGMKLVEMRSPAKEGSEGGPVQVLTIKSVEPGSQADEAGIFSGDRIVQIDGANVNSLKDAELLVDQSRKTLLLFLFDRNGNTFFQSFRKPEIED